MRKKHAAFVALIILLSAVHPMGIVFSDDARPEADKQIRKNITSIDSEERRIIEALFSISSDIRLFEIEIEKAAMAVDDKRREQTRQKELLNNQEQLFERQRQSLGQILRNQQRAGVGSRLNTLLSAENLKDFITRINILRDVTRGTQKQLVAMRQLSLTMADQQAQLQETVALLEEKKREIIKNQAAMARSKRELESYLSSLQADRSQYQRALNEMDMHWASLKPLFSQTIEVLNRLIASGGLPPETVSVSGTILNARARFDQSPFNAALSEVAGLPKMKFAFRKEGVTLEFPDQRLQLSGHFRLVTPQKLQFVVTGGVFYDLPLSESALKDLFSEGDILFDLKKMIGKTTIKSINSYEGYLELQVSGF